MYVRTWTRSAMLWCILPFPSWNVSGPQTHCVVHMCNNLFTQAPVNWVFRLLTVFAIIAGVATSILIVYCTLLIFNVCWQTDLKEDCQFYIFSKIIWGEKKEYLRMCFISESPQINILLIFIVVVLCQSERWQMISHSYLWDSFLSILY